MSVSIVSRAAWGAKPWNGDPKSTGPAVVPLASRTEFFVHYDGATHVTRTGAAVPQAIDRQHQAQGWAGIGYSFVVDQAGTAYEGRGWHRQGAHCPGHNVSGLSVQIAVGGDQEPTEAALATARALYDEACRRTGRTLAMRGHRDGIATKCPGDRLYEWVTAGMPVKAGTKPGKPTAPNKPKPPAFPGRHFFRAGANNPHVTQLGRALVAKGYGKHYRTGPGPRWTEADRLNVQAFQRAQGWRGADADGFPGPETWRRLFA
ncbi:endolysin [Streptomyces phage Picard]|uniref:Endolysin n=1 Tax=Streptomyces phage Picard TaxID=1920311 RepID=A0A1J0MC10_9CAUD|nr:endolysin [Streptomyces phage Picard]APD18551.1 endolysin [Streptomyces phage Picard]